VTSRTRPAPSQTRRRTHPAAAPRALRTKAARDIRTQWPQFAAITATMLLGVLLFAASYDAYRNLDASYRGTFDRLHGADLYVEGGDVAALARRAADSDGVAAAATRVQVDLPLRVGPDKLRGRAVGEPTLVSGAAIADLLVLDGRLPGDGQVAVEQHMAEHFDLAPGDEIEALGADGWTRLEVTATVASVEYLWPARSRQEIFALPDDFGVVFTSASTAETLAGAAPDQALVRYTAGADAAGLDQRLGDAARNGGATAVTPWDEQPSNSLLQEDVDGFSEMATSFPLLFLGAAALATYVLLTRRVQSERDIIGMLLASGVRRRHVLVHYLSYGLAAGAVGGVAGVLLGVPAAREMTRLYLGVISLPPDVAVVGWRPLTAIGGIAYGVVAGVLAGLAPALAASRIPPAEAMRPVIPASGGRRSLAERLLPPLRRLPARWLLVIRGIGRNRRRTLSTVLGVILSLLLILVSWGMIDTMDALLAEQFDVVQRQDARVDLTPGPDGPPLAELRGIAGIETVERSVTLPVGVTTAEETYGTTLVALAPDTRMHGFVATDRTRMDLPADGLLVGKAMREVLDVAVGDRVTVRTADGRLSVDTVVRGFVDEPLGTFAYISLERLDELSGGAAPTTSAYLRFSPGADRTAVRRAVVDLPGVAAYEDAQAVRQLFERVTGLFYGFVGAMLALGGLMAFAIIFTTMSVNILERAREVATLRASGIHPGTLARLITAENLLTTLLGVVPGLVVGVAGAAVMLDHYSSDQFDLSLVVRPGTLVGSAVAIVAVALVSQWPGLRALRRLDIATVVRERH
jgi:putative ABC transport system permease protein